jgi:uncharacterized protein (UPF0333 family)
VPAAATTLKSKGKIQLLLKILHFFFVLFNNIVQSFFLSPKTQECSASSTTENITTEI